MPMIYMISTSLKPNGALYEFPPHFLPSAENITTENYAYIFSQGKFYRNFLNSAFVALVTVLIAAFIATAYSELCAIILKAPTTLFLIPANIPLVPRSGLYYTMQALIVGDHEEFRAKGANTVYTACGIAIGIIAASLLLYIIKRTVLSAKKHSPDFDQK